MFLLLLHLQNWSAASANLMMTRTASLKLYKILLVVHPCLPVNDYSILTAAREWYEVIGEVLNAEEKVNESQNAITGVTCCKRHLAAPDKFLFRGVSDANFENQ